ncbi:hypothetical protein B6I21_09295 [candidate division KSB1 bacterium 4572_119]|nr:MAG: hypothetical protein B6I21_09295 [candidate division KSB1 bacterium 4572_119]
MIPEDRKGRIYRSMYEGAVWENTNFPDTAVTAIGINPQNPKTAYAGAYNPFYAQWGLYKIVEGLKWEKIMPLPFEERLFRINCIEVSHTDSNIVFVGTDQGLYMSLDNALTWNYNLGPFNISSIQFFKKKVFVTTNGNTRSDGIYVSYDLGETWQIYTYWLFCTEMIAGQRLNPVQPAYFILGDTLKGVSVTRESPYNWQNISETLPVKQVTSLAYFFQRPTSIFAGTVNGVYKYGQVHTEVIPHYDEKITQLKKAHLIKNYPNPFNASTIIQYQIPKFSFVRMKIFNTLGQEIKCLVETQKETGSYSIKWDGKDKLGNNVVSGIYLVRLESEAFVDMKKTLLIR